MFQNRPVVSGDEIRDTSFDRLENMLRVGPVFLANTKDLSKVRKVRLVYDAALHETTTSSIDVGTLARSRGRYVWNLTERLINSKIGLSIFSVDLVQFGFHRF